MRNSFLQICASEGLEIFEPPIVVEASRRTHVRTRLRIKEIRRSRSPGTESAATRPTTSRKTESDHSDVLSCALHSVGVKACYL